MPEEVTSGAIDQILLSWTTHPAKARPGTTMILVPFLILLVIIVYTLTLSAFFTILAAIILWGSLSQYFFPTTYELTEQRVRVKYVINKVEKEWAQYRSYYRDKNGVLLSPFVRPSRLENFRGLYVRFAGNADAVLKIVSARIPMPETPD